LGYVYTPKMRSPMKKEPLAVDRPAAPARRATGPDPTRRPDWLLVLIGGLLLLTLLIGWLVEWPG
jgi:hypothetical protein